MSILKNASLLYFRSFDRCIYDRVGDIRFDTEANLRLWMHSPTRARLIEQVQPLFVKGDDFYISSGLDFWFTPSGAKAQVPVRWLFR